MSWWLTSIWLEFLYFAGCAFIAERFGRGRGAILKFERVRPRRHGSFQPLQSTEITPQFLERLLLAVRRWGYDIVSIDQAHERLQSPPTRSSRRFVCLTFDIGYRDFLEHAWPIFKKHGAAVTVYIPASFPDQLGELWWLALQELVATQDRIGLVVGGTERRLACRSLEEKTQTYDFLYRVLRGMAPADCSNTIRDLCRRYGINLQAVSSAAVMNWQEIATIAADPLATIGSASVGYPVLSKLDPQSSERELRMGRAVIESAIGRSAPHLAYPFGESDTLGWREIISASQAGFATAVTAQAGVLRGRDASEMMSLPRITWDGRRTSLRELRVALAGLGLARLFGRRGAAATRREPTST